MPIKSGGFDDPAQGWAGGRAADVDPRLGIARWLERQACRANEAKGILVAALGVLAWYYVYERAPKPQRERSTHYWRGER